MKHLPHLYSPAVVAMMSLRMDAAHGTPTFVEKAEAVIGVGDPTQRAAILAGIHNDLTKEEQAVASLFQPLINVAKVDVKGDLTDLLKGVLSAVPKITSFKGAMNLVAAALEAESGPIAAQAASLGQTTMLTAVAAALSAVGHLNVGP